MSTINEKFSCLDGLVGITNSDCECLGTILDSYKVSSQSIFIDQILNPVIELRYNNCNDVNANAWAGIVEKRIDAINAVGNEISIRLTEKYNKLHNTFDVVVGRQTFVSTDYGTLEPELVFKTKKIDGYKFFINRIGLLVNTSREIIVSITKVSEDGTSELVREIAVNAINSTPNLFTIKSDNIADPVILDCDGSTYYFNFELDGFLVLNNQIYNSCSKCNDDLVPFIKFLDCEFKNINKNKANGFILDIKGFCDIEKLLCLILSESPELSFLVGKVIAYKTALNCLEAAKVSASKFNLIANNNIDDTILMYEKEYYAGINRFLKADLPVINKSCFCKNSKSIIAVR